MQNAIKPVVAKCPKTLFHRCKKCTMNKWKMCSSRCPKTLIHRCEKPQLGSVRLRLWRHCRPSHCDAANFFVARCSEMINATDGRTTLAPKSQSPGSECGGDRENSISSSLSLSSVLLPLLNQRSASLFVCCCVSVTAAAWRSVPPVCASRCHYNKTTAR